MLHQHRHTCSRMYIRANYTSAYTAKPITAKRTWRITRTRLRMQANASFQKSLIDTQSKFYNLKPIQKKQDWEQPNTRQSKKSCLTAEPFGMSAINTYACPVTSSKITNQFVIVAHTMRITMRPLFHSVSCTYSMCQLKPATPSRLMWPTRFSFANE